MNIDIIIDVLKGIGNIALVLLGAFLLSGCFFLIASVISSLLVTIWFYICGILVFFIAIPFTIWKYYKLSATKTDTEFMGKINEILGDLLKTQKKERESNETL